MEVIPHFLDKTGHTARRITLITQVLFLKRILRFILFSLVTRVDIVAYGYLQPV
jgi:hypothetical protein